MQLVTVTMHGQDCVQAAQAWLLCVKDEAVVLELLGGTAFDSDERPICEIEQEAEDASFRWAVGALVARNGRRAICELTAGLFH